MKMNAILEAFRLADKTNRVTQRKENIHVPLIGV